MGAPNGNEFWKNRSTHGRAKIFEKPEYLWESALEYFDWCNNNPLIEIDFVGKDATQVQKPKMRPFTWSGLEIFLDIHSLKDYKANPEYKDFSNVITRIEKVLYTQKFEGAAAGFLNPNIIARDLRLFDNVVPPSNLIVTITGPEPPKD